MRTTTITKPAQANAEKKWFIVNAEGQTLGRLASEVAKVLRGKNKPTFQPHMDAGDYVIIINAEKIALSGNKINQKEYFKHSGYIGGDKLVPIRTMLHKKPEWVVEHAVKGMLPKNSLGRQTFRKLFVYKGDTHPHQAQKPEELIFNK